MERFEIVSKRVLAERVNEYVVYAPDVARHARAGQFVILRTDDEGERVPFTVCDYDREAGTVCILVQEVGYTTKKLAEMNAGDRLRDFVGPLGNPTDLSGYERILLIGGGIGSAVVYPQDGTSAVPDGSALIRGAAHPDNAKRFLDFTVSYEVQQLLSEQYRRPVRGAQPGKVEGYVPISCFSG